MHIYFINYLSALHGRPWNCTQANFTVGARGSHKQTKFQDRLCLLGVSNSEARNKIRVLTVSKTLALSDIILKLFPDTDIRGCCFNKSESTESDRHSDYTTLWAG